MIEYNIPDSVDFRKIAFDEPEISMVTGGRITDRCQKLLTSETDYKYAFLTPSCTSAIEIMAQLMAARGLTDIIVPSYTFSTSVIPFLERGIRITFCDIDEVTGCICPKALKEIIGHQHDAVLVVSYAGNLPNQSLLNDICKEFGCLMFQDDAQSIGNIGKNKSIAPIADMSAVSFHYTKNISCGEGGCLLFNNDNYYDEVQQFINKGTNRHKFIDGTVDKYNWVSLGSSHLVSEMTALILENNLQFTDRITRSRVNQWRTYAQSLGGKYTYLHENSGDVNGHIFAVIVDCRSKQTEFIQYLKNLGIRATSHYTNLACSPYVTQHNLAVEQIGSQKLADTIVRLPIGAHVQDEDLSYIIDCCLNFKD